MSGGGAKVHIISFNVEMIKRRRRDVLNYTWESKAGNLYNGGAITLDKKWIKVCNGAAPYGWYRLRYNNSKSYWYITFFTQDGEKNERSVNEAIIEVIDAYIFEKTILNVNLIS